MTLGTEAQGEITSGDCLVEFRLGSRGEHWTFVAPGGSRVTIRMTGGTNQDPYLYLLDDSGRIIAEDDDGGSGLDSLISSALLPRTGTYTIVATTYSSGATGTYRILAALANSECNARAVSSSASLSGEISNTDCRPAERPQPSDLYQVSLTSGDTLTIEMLRETLADPFLLLLDVTGAIVAWDDDSADNLNARIRFDATASGRYTIIAAGYSTDDRGTYTLRLTSGSHTTTEDSLVEVGALWVNDYSGPRDKNNVPLTDLRGTQEDASGFVQQIRLRLSGTMVQFDIGDAQTNATQFHDTSSGGEDHRYIDSVDLAYFSGHGGTLNGAAVMALGHPDLFLAQSSYMRLGDLDLEWLVLSACEVLTDQGWETAWSNSPFKGLHMVLGFRTTSLDRFGLSKLFVPNVGPNLANRLADGDPIASAWLDVATNFWVQLLGQNFPAVLAAEMSETSTATLDTDHFHGTGTTVSDIPDPRFLRRRFIR